MSYILYPLSYVLRNSDWTRDRCCADNARRTAAMISSSPSFQPLYLQIKGLLERSLENGEWAPAEAIPSEHELARRFGVSQGTVRKAIQALGAGNRAGRRGGRATWGMCALDECPGSRRLEVPRAKASAESARRLDLKPGDGVILLRRVLGF